MSALVMRRGMHICVAVMRIAEGDDYVTIQGIL